VGAIDAVARNRPTATEEKKKSFLYFGCDFSGWYNFRKIIKIVATRCHILKLKCTKFDFGWGSAQTPLGELQTLPIATALALGSTSKGTDGEGKGKGGEEKP